MATLSILCLLCIFLSVQVNAFDGIPFERKDVLRSVTNRAKVVTALRLQEDLRICDDDTKHLTMFHMGNGKDLDIHKGPVIPERFFFENITFKDMVHSLNKARCRCSQNENSLTSMVVPLVLTDSHMRTALAKCIVGDYEPTFEDKVDYYGEVIYTMPQNLLAEETNRTNACFDKHGQSTNMFPFLTGCVLVSSSTYTDGKRLNTSFYVGPFSHRDMQAALPQYKDDNFDPFWYIFLSVPYDIWQQRIDYHENATTIAMLKDKPCRGHRIDMYNESMTHFVVLCFFMPDDVVATEIKNGLNQSHIICPVVGHGSVSEFFYAKCGIHITVRGEKNNIDIYKHNLNCQAQHTHTHDEESKSSHNCTIIDKLLPSVSTAVCCENDHFCNLDAIQRVEQFQSDPVCGIDLNFNDDITEASCSTQLVFAYHKMNNQFTIIAINDDGFHNLYSDTTKTIDISTELDQIFPNASIIRHQIAIVIFHDPNHSLDCLTYDEIAYPMVQLYCRTSQCDKLIYDNRLELTEVMKKALTSYFCEVGTKFYHISPSVREHNTSTIETPISMACSVTVDAVVVGTNDDEDTLFSVTGEIAILNHTNHDYCTCDDPAPGSSSFRCCWLTMMDTITMLDVINKIHRVVNAEENNKADKHTGNYKDRCPRKGFPRLGKYCEPGHLGCYMVTDVATPPEDDEHKNKVYGNCIGTLQKQSKDSPVELKHALLCEAEDFHDTCTWVVDGDRVSQVCCCNTQHLRSKVYTCENPVGDLFKNVEAEPKRVGEFQDKIQN